MNRLGRDLKLAAAGLTNRSTQGWPGSLRENERRTAFASGHHIPGKRAHRRQTLCATTLPMYNFEDADRVSKFSKAFRNPLKEAGVEVVRLPYRPPNLNAYAEQFVKSIKDECFNRMIFFGERSLRNPTRSFLQLLLCRDVSQNEPIRSWVRPAKCAALMRLPDRPTQDSRERHRWRTTDDDDAFAGRRVEGVPGE
jgi:hypothetical protein